MKQTIISHVSYSPEGPTLTYRYVDEPGYPWGDYLRLLTPNLSLWEHLGLIAFFLMIMDYSHHQDHLADGLFVNLSFGLASILFLTRLVSATLDRLEEL